MTCHRTRCALSLALALVLLPAAPACKSGKPSADAGPSATGGPSPPGGAAGSAAPAKPKAPPKPAGRWEPVADLPFALNSPSATLLADGRVFAFGDTHERRGAIYDPNKKTWTATEPARFPRPDHGASRLPNGRVLVTGGINVEKEYYVLRTTEIFDPKTGTWERGEHLPTRRRGHTQTPLSDGRVLVTGGDPGGFAPPIRRVDAYNPGDGKWDGLGELVLGRYDHAAVRLSSDRVLVVGGSGKDEALDSAEICSPGETRCRKLTIQGKRNRPGVVALKSGDVLIVGGLAKRSMAPTELLFDPGKSSFDAAPPCDERRLGGHSTTALTDGRVLIAGGDKDALSLAEVFDPQARAWAPVPALPSGRTDHAAVRLKDGSVLLVGGEDGNGGPIKTATLYLPQS